MSEFLIERWCQALPADCGSAAAQAAGAELVARWSEPARRYHTVDHLTFMLTVLDEAAAIADDIHAVRLAAWFHDAVYDPRVPSRPPTSRRSAELAAAMLPPTRGPAGPGRRGGTPGAADRRPPRRAGRSQRRAARRRGSGDPGRRRRALRGLRRTRSAPSIAFVPDDAFRAGRSAVLTKLLALDPLYHLAPHREAWEARARANLTAELSDAAGLTGPRRLGDAGRPR